MDCFGDATSTYFSGNLVYRNLPWEEYLTRPPDCEFKQCFRRFRANPDFGELRPLAARIYPHHRFGRA